MNRALVSMSMLVVAACGEQMVAVGTGGPKPTPPTPPADAGTRQLPPAPKVELCGNHVDDDLDGLIDENCGCSQGESRPCWEGDPALNGVGACRPGTQRCVLATEFYVWGACENAV